MGRPPAGSLRPQNSLRDAGRCGGMPRHYQLTRSWSGQTESREATMIRTVMVALALTMASQSHAQEGGRLAAAANAMGAANLNSIEYSGSGQVFGFGQAFEPGERWPRFVQRSYTMAANYQAPG